MTDPNADQATAPLRLFNSLSRRLEEFHGERAVRMYTCGPTVYAPAHVGNMRAYVAADVLRRTLAWRGHEVTQVVNITDVGHLVGDTDDGDDKVNVAALRQRVAVRELTHRHFDGFVRDLDALGVLPPSRFTWASDYIPQMIGLARALEDRGVAYRLPSGLYFDTASDPGYGAMATVDVTALEEGARIGTVAGRRRPTDFALWRTFDAADRRVMSWDSPWGRGAPGWHIECSAMSIEALGAHFDIHTGGVDHLNVHHINEIAQSEAYLDDGQPWVGHWMHSEFLTDGGRKVSKSAGDRLTVGGLRDAGIDPRGYRWYLLGSHYRRQVAFGLEPVAAAARSLERLADWFANRTGTVPAADVNRPLTTLAEALARSPDPASTALLHKVDHALASDLGTARVVALVPRMRALAGRSSDDLALWNDVLRTVTGVDMVALGLERRRPTIASAPDGDTVEALQAARTEARRAGDFTTADALRDRLRLLGVGVADPARDTVRNAAPSAGLSLDMG